VLSGEGHGDQPFSAMFGSTRAFDADRLDRLYPGGREEYLAAFEKRADDAIAAGFILAADRAEILAVGKAACPIQ
jgi:hypothetical protein